MNVTPTLIAEKLRHVSPFWYKLGAQAYIDKTYPRHLFIETTSACNLSCSYCPRERRTNEMEFGLFKDIVTEASHYGSRSFSLHLFGEPTLYRYWKQAIRFIKDTRRTNTVLLTTNGTRLNSIVDDLTQSGVDKVIWTWRPEAVFTPETKEKLRKWGKFMVRLIEEITPKHAYEEWGEWKPQERKSLHNYGATIDTSLFRKEESGAVNVPAGSSMERWPCYHLWLAPAVAWNGNILMCCNDPHQKEVLGTFPQMTVAQAWQSDRLKMIRESHLKGEYGGICKGCDSWRTYPDIFFKRQRR